MRTTLIRKTAIELYNICKELEFGGNIETKTYYDNVDEYCLIVEDNNINYCLVVFNESILKVEVKGSWSQHTVLISIDYKASAKHLYNIIKLMIEYTNDYNNACIKGGE